LPEDPDRIHGGRSVELGADLMLCHDYLENDFDVHERAAPEFREQAVRALHEERWNKAITDNLLEPTELRLGPRRMG